MSPLTAARLIELRATTAARYIVVADEGLSTVVFVIPNDEDKPFFMIMNPQHFDAGPAVH